MELTPTQSTARILIVDDDEATQESLSLLLEGEGYQVTSATSAKKGLEILKKNASRVDLLILDLYMPEMNGLEFAAVIKNTALYQKPTIIASSATSKASEKEAAASEFDYFLPKPFNLDTLLKVCHRFTH